MPKAAESAVIERHGTKSFDVGVAELNGWRTDMEDAHLIYLTDDIGVFGVYDGHGGKDCSKFAARRIHDELEKNGVPVYNSTMQLFGMIRESSVRLSPCLECPGFAIVNYMNVESETWEHIAKLQTVA